MTPAIVTILLIGLILGLGIYILSEFRQNVATDQTGSDVNINISASGGTTTLGDSTKDNYYLKSLSVVNNTGTTIPSTNYSYTTVGVITWDDWLLNGTYSNLYPYGATGANVTSTYIYDVPYSAEEGVMSTIDGLGDFADWIAVIVVVIAAAIVLGIVLRSFGGSRGV